MFFSCLHLPHCCRRLQGVNLTTCLRALQVPLQDDLNAIKVLQLFASVSDEDCELLDLAGRPERLIMTYLPVPPVAIRPSVESFEASGVNEDDATMKVGVRACALYRFGGQRLLFLWTAGTRLIPGKCSVPHRSFSCEASNWALTALFFMVQRVVSDF